MLYGGWKKPLEYFCWSWYSELADIEAHTDAFWAGCMPMVWLE